MEPVIIDNIKGIENKYFSSLAFEIYTRLITTNRISLCEILGDDVYFQIGDKELFTFSVEVRGNDTEFFLYEYNFTIVNDEDFELYKRNILCVIESSIEGNYSIELHKAGKKLIKSEIVFKNSLRIGLYDNLILRLIRSLIPMSTISSSVQSGKRI